MGTDINLFDWVYIHIAGWARGQQSGLHQSFFRPPSCLRKAKLVLLAGAKCLP